MEQQVHFRIQIALYLLTAALPAFTQDFPARHQHAKGYCEGLVKITPEGIAYSQSLPAKSAQKIGKPENRHEFMWKFEDIQEIDVSVESLRIFAFGDGKSSIGGEHEATFSGDFQRAYLRLEGRMDSRLVARFADDRVQPLWTLAVKRLGRSPGTQGELLIGSDKLVFKSAAKDTCRTWRYSDIASITSTGPFQLTVGAYERSKLGHSGAKEFKFELKEPLKEEQYYNLSRRVPKNDSLFPVGRGN